MPPRYHQGNGWAGWEIRECGDCGAKITLKSLASMHHYDDVTGETWSVCGTCLLERRRSP